MYSTGFEESKCNKLLSNKVWHLKMVEQERKESEVNVSVKLSMQYPGSHGCT